MDDTGYAILNQDREIQKVLQEQSLTQKQKREVVQIDVLGNIICVSNVENTHGM